MKFRIIKYNNRYCPQVKDKEFYNGYQWEDKWVNIGYSDGYSCIEVARLYCEEYKNEHLEEVVEEFEL